MEGITLSHPANRGLTGRSVINLKGANGKELIKDFIAVAKNPSLKRSYIKKVPQYDILVGAGYYR